VLENNIDQRTGCYFDEGCADPARMAKSRALKENIFGSFGTALLHSNEVAFFSPRLHEQLQLLNVI